MSDSGNSSRGLHSGVVIALASALLFGVTTPIAKQLLAGTQPLLIAGLLYLGSGIGVSILRLIQDRGWSATGLRANDWLWLAGSTLVGGIVAPALLMIGLARADAGGSLAAIESRGRVYCRSRMGGLRRAR